METNENATVSEDKSLSVPGAIVVAGILIAIAILYTGGSKQNAQGKAKNADNLAPITSKDHILGNPNAKVKVVEFSDLQCPYCQSFHPTMKRIMDTYGKTGQVAWVYRHFPLSFHPLAGPGAVASECVANLGGNIQFWNYIDAVFSVGLTVDNESLLNTSATKIGIDLDKFNECIEKNPNKALIEAHVNDGLLSGVGGTPYSIVIAPNGKKYPISGAQPYEAVADVIERALKDI